MNNFFKYLSTFFLISSFTVGQIYLFYDVKKDLIEIYGVKHSSCDIENDCCTNNSDSCCDDGCTCISHPCTTGVALCYIPLASFFHSFNPKNLDFISFQQIYDFNFLNDIFHPPAV